MRYGLMAIEAITELDPTLEVVKLLDNQAQQAKSGEYDQFHEEVKTQLETKEILEVEAPSGSSESSPAPEEVLEDDTDADTDVKSEVSEEETEDTNATIDADKEKEEKDDSDNEEEDEKPSEAETAVREAFRTEYYDQKVAEAFFHGIDYSALMLKALSMLKEAAVWVGFEVTPYVAQKVAAGTLWVFAKSAILGSKMTVAAGERVRRIKMSVPRRLKEVDSLRQALKVIREAQVDATDEVAETSSSAVAMLRDEKMLKWFTVGQKTDPLMAGLALRRFTDHALRNMGRGVLQDIGDLEKIIEFTGRGTQTNVLTFMRIAPFDATFLKRPVKGYSDHPDLLDTYVYQQSLPNGLLFIANLPKAGLRDIETTSDAYKASGILLGIDAKSAVPSEEMPYLSLDQAEKFLDVLEQIGKDMLDQSSFYTRIEKQSDSLKLGYRHYYQKLVGSKERQTLQETLAEYVYLKQAFVTKTYLPAAMDVHDYVATFLSTGLRYVKLSLKHQAR